MCPDATGQKVLRRSSGARQRDGSDALRRRLCHDPGDLGGLAVAGRGLSFASVGHAESAQAHHGGGDQQHGPIGSLLLAGVLPVRENDQEPFSSVLDVMFAA